MANAKKNLYRVKVASYINHRMVGPGELVELEEGTEPGENLEPATNVEKGEPIHGPAVDQPTETTDTELTRPSQPLSDKGTIHTESTHDGDPNRPPPDYNDGHANDTGKWQREVGDAGKQGANKVSTSKQSGKK